MHHTADFTLRPAGEAEAGTIQSMIRDARINPIGLDWRRFELAISSSGEVIGCAQIKPHADGSHELASLAVVPAWRGRGVARSLIERLLASHPEKLYLTCRAGLGGLYVKFGFRRVDLDEMTPYFKRITRLVRILRRTGLVGEDLWVMVRDGEAVIGMPSPVSSN